MNRYKKALLIVISINLALFLTGCWDAKSLEALNIPSASGFEVVNAPDSDKNQMEVYAVMPVFYKNAPEKSIVDITRGNLNGEIRSMRFQNLSEELSLGSVQVSILGSNLAKEGVRDILDILIRTPQIKNNLILAVAEDNIADIFQLVPKNYPNVGIYMYRLLNNAFKESFIPTSDLHHFNVAMGTPGWHPIAPLLKVQGKEIYISGYGIFKDDKIAHTITTPEARILSILRDLPSSGNWSFSMTCNENIPCSASVTMNNKVKVKVTRDDTAYHFDISIQSKGNLVELLPNINLRSLNKEVYPKVNLIKSKTLLSEIEKGYEEFLKKEAEALIHKAQNEYKMDIFNLVKFAQAKWREDVDNTDWDECFSRASINVNVNAKIMYVGEET